MSSIAWDICDFEGVPRVSLDFGVTQKATFAQGTVWAEGPSHRKFQGVKSLRVLQESPPHAEAHLARKRNSLERSKRGVGPFSAFQGFL